MYKIIAKVNGMKCGMCEKHVNEAIMSSFKVKKVKSSHESSETIITSKEDIDLDSVKKTIVEAGYEVVDITKETVKSLF